MKRPGPGLVAVLAVVALLLAARAAAPAIVAAQFNRHLTALQTYTGTVGDIDLSLWRGAYVIHDLRIVKREAAPDTPLFVARRVEVGVSRPALWEGRLLGVVKVEGAQINFVDGPGDRDQAGIEENWPRLFDRLVPFRVDRAELGSGEVHFFNYAGAHVYIKDVRGNAENLANSEELDDPLPGRVRVQGNALDGGATEFSARLSDDPRRPDFSVDFRAYKLDLARLKLVSSTYLPFDIDAGTMDLVVELEGRDHRMTGYAKPMLKSVKIISIEGDLKRDRDHPLRLLTESVASLFIEVFENQGTGRFATRIPIDGRYGETRKNWVAAAWGVLANALFIEPLRPDFESGG